MITFLGKNKFTNQNILHRVLQNETLEDIANRYNIPSKVLEKKYGKNLYEGECLIIPNTNKKYHIVKPLDTLESISKQYDISISELKNKNDVTKIFIGQILEI